MSGNFKVNNRNTRIRCKICSKSTITDKNDAIGIVLVSLLLTFNKFYTLSSVSIVNFEQVSAGWVKINSFFYTCHTQKNLEAKEVLSLSQGDKMTGNERQCVTYYLSEWTNTCSKQTAKTMEQLPRSLHKRSVSVWISFENQHKKMFCVNKKKLAPREK